MSFQSLKDQWVNRTASTSGENLHRIHGNHAAAASDEGR